MKRLFRIISPALLVALHACATSWPSWNSRTAAIFTAVAEQGIATRTSLGTASSDGGIPVLWSAGDRIIIASEGQKAESYYATDDNGGEAVFRFINGLDGNVPPPEDQPLAALYPAEAYSWSDGRHTITIPSRQTFIKGGIDSGVMPMLADASTDRLSFKNICGLLRIRLSTLGKDVSLTEIKIAANQDMSGPIASFSNSEVIWDSESRSGSDTGKSITLSCADAAISAKPEEFILAVPPAEYTNFRIQLKTDGADGAERIYYMSEPLHIERSMITTVNLDLAQFRKAGTEDVIGGDRISAMTRIEYGLECTAGKIEVYREGGSGTATMKSYLRETCADGSENTEGIPWTAEFSEDNGKTWSSSMPEMLTGSTFSGDNPEKGVLLSYKIQPSRTDRECLVRFRQHDSGKERDIRIVQYANVIVATYETSTSNERRDICLSKKHNITAAVYDDGQEDIISAQDDFIRLSHVFGEPGRHTVKLRVGKGAVSFDNMFSSNGYNKEEEYLVAADLSHAELDDITSMESMFANCSHLESCHIGEVSTPSLANIRRMFYGCTSLSDIDISSMQTGNVTDMSELFKSCYALSEIDLEGFSTSSAINMNNMFYRCSALKSLDLSGFDTSSVTNMESMCSGCSALEYIITDGLNTSMVTDMSGMFSYCSKLKSLDLSSFDTSRCENMNSMFCNCSSLTDLDISGFDTPECRYMSSMFDGCARLQTLDIRSFRTDKVKYMSNMFYNCKKIEELDLSNFYTPEVKSMSYMFKGCTSLRTLDVSRLVATNVENTREMFSECGAISIELKDFNAPKLTNASHMFYSCSAESISITDFSCGEGARLYGMFSFCSSLKSLNLINFDGSRAADMSYMFSDCINLMELDLSTCRSDNVNSMNGMFMNCNKMRKLDISGLRTSKVTDMSGMFSCKSLEALDLSRFDTSNVTNMNHMFSYNRSLKELDISNFDLSKVTGMASMFSSCESLSSIRMDMSRVSETLNCSNMFHIMPAEGTLFAKGGAIDSHIAAELPARWRIEAF